MKLKYIITACILLMTLSACNDFLDEMPDNRTEVDTKEKITKLLVTAYPQSNWNMLAEFSSDNADDNGPKYSIMDRLSRETYEWKDTEENGDDSPHTFWTYTYQAIATANKALEAIDDMGNPAELSAQRGEALLCRAYGHFALSYIFCEAWSEKNKNTAPGIPYAIKVETTVNPQYDRETIGATYDKIEKDLEEGLPLIDDNLYSVPKYHFNKKAAYAFAARFYLYRRKYDKAIECATRALGSNPSLVLRDWSALGKLSLNDNLQPDAYVDASNTANLLLTTTRSWWGLYNGPLTLTNRYTHNSVIADAETCSSTGVWGDCATTLRHQAADYSSIPKVVFRKFPLMYMEYTDVTAQIGYYNLVNVLFNTDETLLVRAEAYAMTKQYDKAIADMQMWQDAYTTSKVKLTTDEVNRFYGSIAFYTPTKPTVKKRIEPDFTVEAGTQENMIHFILHARRITTLHEGLRWGDIKRYGITIYRRTVVGRNDITVTDELKPGDPRRAIQIPSSVISAGLQPNPRN